MGDGEAVDITVLIVAGAIAISIIFAYVIVPGLASNNQLTQLLYVIVTGIFSVISFTVGKNSKRS